MNEGFWEVMGRQCTHRLDACRCPEDVGPSGIAHGREGATRFLLDRSHQAMALRHVMDAHVIQALVRAA